MAADFCALVWVVGALVVAAMLLLGRFLLPPLFAQAARTKSPELFLAVSLLVVILASGYAYIASEVMRQPVASPISTPASTSPPMR